MKDYTLICAFSAFAYALFRYLRVRHTNNSLVELSKIQKSIEIERIQAQKDLERIKIEINKELEEERNPSATPNIGD